MGVRPPTNDDDDDDGPASVDFGIAALDARLDDELTFPASAEEVVAAVGDDPVPVDPQGNAVDVREVLDAADRDQFESRNDLLNALHPVFEEYRRSSGGGVVSWVRSLLPGQ